MENVTLTPKEQTRLQVLNNLLAEHMTLDQAATLLGVSERHTRRILAAYREEGAARSCSRVSGPQGLQRNSRCRCNCCCPASTILAGLASIIFAGAPPLPGPAAGPHWYESWAHRIPG